MNMRTSFGSSGGGGTDIGSLGSMNIGTSIGGSGGGGTVIGSPGPGC